VRVRKSQMLKSAPIFAALGDATRLAIVSRLSTEGPLPTIALGKDAQVSRQALTKHLQLLEEIGIVKSERVGRDRRWQIKTQRIEEVRRYLDQISAQWDARVERLRNFVEEGDD